MVVEPVLISNPRNFNGRINCIFQDKTGFIWIGKATGLFRYDGYQLKSYRHNASDTTSISNDNILAIYEDSKGYIWIGTKGGGLNRFDKKTGKFRHYLHNDQNSQSISYDEVYSILPGANDNFWIGTDGGGFNYFNHNTQLFKTFRQDINSNIGLRSNKILCFANAGNNKLWMGTWSGGLHLFDTLTHEISHFGDGTSFSSINIFDIKEVSPGTLWLATWGQGLIAYDIKFDLFSIIIPPSEILNFYCIQSNSKGQIWVGSGEGLLFFSSSTSGYFSPENPIPTPVVVLCLCQDNAGTIWVGTSSGSIERINIHQKKFSQIPSDLPFSRSPVVSVLSMKTKNHVYFSYRNKLIQFNTKTYQYKSFQSPYTDLVAMVDVPGTNLIMCGSSNGLSLFDQDSYSFSKLIISSKYHSEIFRNQICTLFSIDSAGFWIGAQGSAYNINYEANIKVWKLLKVYFTGSLESLPESHYPSYFLKDRKGNFWVGTWGGGLNCLSKEAKNFKPMLHDPANSGTISDNFVECLEEDHDGIIWVGTHLGVNRLSTDKASFTNISKSDGLANNWITALAVDSKNRIWASTQGGISCISDDGKSIRNFDSNDGLPSNTFFARSVTTDSSGNIYFGSEMGLIWFNPDSISNNPYVPKAVITDFRINNDTVTISESSPLHQNIEVTQDISLNYKQSTFSFKITPLSYFNPGKNRIKFILKGYEKTWKVAGSDRIAKYSNIPPGKYTFSVIASNEDGIWNLNETNIGITIRRPFWRTGWAIAFYILCLAFLANFILYRSGSVKANYKLHPEKKVNSDLIQPNQILIESAEMQFINKALNIVEENMANPNFGVDEMCSRMSISRSQLYRKINSVSGLSISEFIKEIRLKRAAQLLKQNPQSIAEIAYSVGFNDPKYFSKCFKQKYNVSPAQYITNFEQSLPPQ